MPRMTGVRPFARNAARPPSTVATNVLNSGPKRAASAAFAPGAHCWTRLVADLACLMIPIFRSGYAAWIPLPKPSSGPNRSPAASGASDAWRSGIHVLGAAPLMMSAE
jgi:hypothetical protein